MIRRQWVRDLRHEDYQREVEAQRAHEEYEQALTEAMARHTYGLETCPPDEPPVCPHCHSTALYSLPDPTRVLCHGCGRSYREDQLK